LDIFVVQDLVVTSSYFACDGLIQEIERGTAHPDLSVFSGDRCHDRPPLQEANLRTYL
jgi:hypothetical protein